jgi:hypothetical protein
MVKIFGIGIDITSRSRHEKNKTHSITSRSRQEKKYKASETPGNFS